MSAIELSVRCAPWRNGRVASHRVSVDMVDGTVRVWDPIASHYTVHHALSARSCARIMRLARGAS